MKRYDVNHYTKASFNTYAYYYILKEIRRTTHNYGNFVRVPVHWFESKEETKFVRVLPFTEKNLGFIEHLASKQEEVRDYFKEQDTTNTDFFVNTLP